MFEYFEKTVIDAIADEETPSDAPDLVDQDAVAALLRLRDELTAWLPVAAVQPLPPVQWRDMLILLDAAARVVAAADTDDVAVYTPARIDIYPHPSVPLDGRCARCHRDLDDPIHPL